MVKNKKVRIGDWEIKMVGLQEVILKEIFILVISCSLAILSHKNNFSFLSLINLYPVAMNDSSKVTIWNIYRFNICKPKVV